MKNICDCKIKNNIIFSNTFVENNGKDYLSKSNTNCLKGILSICILIHHLYQRSNWLHDIWLGAVFQYMGYLAVSLFFFISGYGLMYSYQTKKAEYIKNFPKNRLLTFYCVCILSVVIYTLFDWICGKNFKVTDILQSLTFGNTLVKSGWYLQTIFIFYILFYFSAKYCRTNTALISMICCGTFLYIGLCLCLKLMPTWYDSIWCFAFGILWCACKKNIDYFVCRKEKNLIILGIALSFCISFILGTQEFIGLIYIRLAFKMLSAVFFSALSILLLMRLPIQNILTRNLGKISLEIYVIHGLVLELFRGKFIFINDDLFYAVMVIAVVLCLAVMLHFIVGYIYKMIKNTGANKQKVNCV